MPKKITPLIVGLTVLLLAAPPDAAAGKVIERIIARVNNEIITEKQFEQEKQKLRAQLAQQYTGADLEQAYQDQVKNLLRDMIDQDLMVQKAKDLDLKVESDVVRREDDIRKDAHLETIADLQAEVEKQGLVWEDFEDNIRRNLLMREVIGREVGYQIRVSHEETKKYYEGHKQEFEFPEGVHLGEILISTADRKPEEAEKRGKDALAELKSGARWDVVARKYSDDQSASQGGDIGFFESGKLAPALAAAIAKLDEKEYTDLIEVKNGYMILKVLERRKQGLAKIEDVEQRISEFLYNQQMEPALREYLRTLRKQSFIYLASGYIDTGAERPTRAALAK